MRTIPPSIPRGAPRLPLQEAPDALLAERATDGDRRAFAVLVRRHGGLLRANATRVTGRAAWSDDIVQEALVTAWQQLDTLQDPSAVRAWLVRITARKALDHARTQREHGDVDDVEAPGSDASRPDRAAEASSLAQALNAALDRLPALQRQAWVLRESAGQSYDEIAAELEVPVSTVRGALARARRSLSEDLEEWR